MQTNVNQSNPAKIGKEANVSQSTQAHAYAMYKAIGFMNTSEDDFLQQSGNPFKIGLLIKYIYRTSYMLDIRPFVGLAPQNSVLRSNLNHARLTRATFEHI